MDGCWCMECNDRPVTYIRTFVRLQVECASLVTISFTLWTTFSLNPLASQLRRKPCSRAVSASLQGRAKASPSADPSGSMRCCFCSVLHSLQLRTWPRTSM